MKRNGLTVVEFSLIVAIAALIVAISMPAFFQNQQKRRAARCAMTLDAIESASRRHAATSGAFPKRLADLTPTYFSKVPTCPAGGEYKLGTPEGDPPTCSIPSHNLHSPSPRNTP